MHPALDDAQDSPSLDRPARRRALRLAILNGVLWGVGNGLTTGPVITYMQLDLQAPRIGVSLVLALPALVGLLRLVAPALIRRFGSARRTCLLLFAASYALLLTLPPLAFWRQAWASAAMPAWLGLTLLICVHQLFEFIASVALWSWLADLVPERLRGRFFGRRQTLQLLAIIPVTIGAALASDWWTRQAGGDPLLGYAAMILAGAVCLALSLVPLLLMPITRGHLADPRTPLRGQLRGALANRPFRRLLVFGSWFSLANGITQVVQGVYPKDVLKLGLADLTAMRSAMLVGQAAAAPLVGRFSDRFGNRPVLIASQLGVALGMGFFVVATPEQPYWLALSYLSWTAFVGINICQPNLLLKLATPGQAAAYLALFGALSSISYAVSTVGGALALDALQALRGRYSVGPWQFSYQQYLLFLGALLRACGVLLLVGIHEPDAWSWPRLLGLDRRWRRGPKAAEPEREFWEYD